MQMRQVLVTTSLETHRSIDIPADLRAAIEPRANLSTQGRQP
jgi:4-hydroxybenzoyl-CoA thioesterase